MVRNHRSYHFRREYPDFFLSTKRHVKPVNFLFRIPIFYLKLNEFQENFYKGSNEHLEAHDDLIFGYNQTKIHKSNKGKCSGNMDTNTSIKR